MSAEDTEIERGEDIDESGYTEEEEVAAEIKKSENEEDAADSGRKGET